jgi:hypothetical protein
MASRPGPGEPSGFLVVPGRPSVCEACPAIVWLTVSRCHFEMAVASCAASLRVSHRRFHPPPPSHLQPPLQTCCCTGPTTALPRSWRSAARTTTAPRCAAATVDRSGSSSAPSATRLATTSARARTEQGLPESCKIIAHPYAELGREKRHDSVFTLAGPPPLSPTLLAATPPPQDLRAASWPANNLA